VSGRRLEHDWFPRDLPDNVEVGDRSWIYSAYAFLHYRSRQPCGVRIGRDSGIYHGTFFELGPEGRVEIGDFCALVGAVIRTDALVTIADYAFIAHEVVLADEPFAAPPEALPSGPAGPRVEAARGSGAAIVIGENVWIGARALILGGAEIGEASIVGAAAVVDFPVPPYSIVAGNPARVVGEVPRTG
jgi:acetyltransferase-like isoleucine patch superfamily enzyme